jgi:hypothetical protein
MVMTHRLPISRRAPEDRWALLKFPCHCMGHCFFVEVRMVNGRPALPLTEGDVRVVAPICARCGEAMRRGSVGSEGDQYVCPANPAHESETFPRGTDGRTLVDRIPKMTVLTFSLLGRRVAELEERRAARLGSGALG